MSLIYSFYFCACLILFRRYLNFTIIAYLCIFYLLGLVFIFEDFFFLRPAFFSVLENVLNQIFQFFFKLDLNWVFLIFLTCFFFYFSNNIIFFSPLLFVFIFFSWNYAYLYGTYLSLELFKINDKLVNGFFMIHPLLTYIFYSGLIGYAFVYLMSFNVLVGFDKFFIFLWSYGFKRLIMLLLRKYLYIGFSALLLGGWWAQQEINWNGWWGWDFVELANISIFLSVALVYHLCHLKIFHVSYKKYSLFLVILIFFYSILLRYNVFNSLHTFLGVNLTVQVYIYVFMVILWLITYLFAYCLKYLIAITGDYNRFIVINVPTIIVYVLNFVLFAVVAFSFFFYEYFYFLKEFFFLVLVFYLLMLLGPLVLIFILFLSYFISFYALCCGVVFISLLSYLSYRNSKLFHLAIYSYALLFMFCGVDTDYFLWSYSTFITYFITVKSTLLYSFCVDITAVQTCSNYIYNAIFYPEIADSFFFEHRLFSKNSIYVSLEGLIQNSFFFDFFEFKLLFSFVLCLYSLVSLFFLYLVFVFFFLKRKKNYAVM